MKSATLVVVAGKAARGAPGWLAHGRDVAEARDGAVAQCKLVGATSLARLVAGRDALPRGAAALLAGQEQGRGGREKREVKLHLTEFFSKIYIETQKSLNTKVVQNSKY